jgi:hypothetical protein
MNPRELVDYIRSGPAELVLHEPLSFRSSPCDFDEFLQALASSETIRSVNCISHQELSITEDEWVLLIKWKYQRHSTSSLELRRRFS